MTETASKGGKETQHKNTISLVSTDGLKIKFYIPYFHKESKRSYRANLIKARENYFFYFSSLFLYFYMKGEGVLGK